MLRLTCSGNARAGVMSPLIEKDKFQGLPVYLKSDVVVCGGGPAGFGAALSAARRGAKVTLVERYGFLGGMATLSMVNLIAIRNLTPYDGETLPLIRGIPAEFLRRVYELKGTVLPEMALQAKIDNPIIPSWADYLLFDVELTKLVMARMLREVGVNIRLHSLISGVVKEGNLVKGVIVESKSGREAILGDRIIDATGDGDVAFHADAKFEQTIGKDALPVTMIFSFGGANDEEIWAYLERDVGLKNLLQKAPEYITRPDIKFKDIPYPLKIFKAKPPLGKEQNFFQMIRPGQWWVWGLHIFNRNVLDVGDLSECELELRERVFETFNFLKSELPGLEKAYLDQTPTQIGIRESRHFKGVYTLTLDDLLSGRKFEDGIARGRVKDTTAPFHVPYSAILPHETENLLLAGRCISLTHEAATQVSPRNQPTCMAIGEAAGLAATISLEKRISLKNLDAKELQEELLAQGAII